ncbi:hypothetical protein [Actinophytocola oryzae]|uniref:hypothetical protein n=1 Tax=Actinophytocola oryzae TaxID=502181 RepID=UPI001414EDF6|nr:hypothetical protein [Actinophytocola oryzae]
MIFGAARCSSVSLPSTASKTLVVVDLVEDQAEVAFLFLGADFGQELRLGAAESS